MKKLDSESLKRMIRLEMKQLMDEDALFRDYEIPGDDDKYNDYSLATMDSECGCGSCETCNSYELESDCHDSSFDDVHKKSYMAKPQLAKIANYAQKLHDLIGEDEALEDWQESKIAQMSQMMGDVYHSLEYDSEYDDHHEDDLDMHDLIGMIRTGNI